MSDLNKMLKKNRSNKKIAVKKDAIDNILTVVREIPLEKIKPDPNNIRKEYSVEGIKSLAQSIQEKGLLNPILLKQSGNGYMIISGHRRYFAFKESGKESIPAIVKEIPVNDNDKVILQLIENIQREDISTSDKAESIHNLAKKGLKQIQIAKWLGMAEGTVSRYAQIYDLIQTKPKIVSKINSIGIEKSYRKYCMEKNKNSKNKNKAIAFSVKIVDSSDKDEVSSAIKKILTFLSHLESLVTKD